MILSNLQFFFFPHLDNIHVKQLQMLYCDFDICKLQSNIKLVQMLQTH